MSHIMSHIIRAAGDMPSCSAGALTALTPPPDASETKTLRRPCSTSERGDNNTAGIKATKLARSRASIASYLANLACSRGIMARRLSARTAATDKVGRYLNAPLLPLLPLLPSLPSLLLLPSLAPSLAPSLPLLPPTVGIFTDMVSSVQSFGIGCNRNSPCTSTDLTETAPSLTPREPSEEGGMEEKVKTLSEL